MIKIGDLFFVEGSGLISELIQFHTHPGIGTDDYELDAINRGQEIEEFEPSHVELIIGVNHTRQLGDYSGITVISADSNGVWARDVREDEWRKYRILTPKVPFTEEELRNVFLFCRDTSRSGYDFAGLSSFPLNADLQDKDRWFCSEHCFTAYWKGNKHLQERTKPAFVSPSACYMSPILKIVEKGGE